MEQIFDFVAADEDSIQPDVTIVMPCLNEVDSLAHCMGNALDALSRLRTELGMSGEIVIADNGSTDGSQGLATELGARVVPVTARGYGAALIGGCTNARGRYLLMGDCDGSYNFIEGVAMVAKLEDGFDVCMGNRFKGGIEAGAMPWKNRHIGNPGLTGVLNLFFRSGIGDAHCGLRAIRKDAFMRLGLTGSGMEFASEMVIKSALLKFKMTEVPATLSKDLRDRAPHLRPFRDGWRHLRYLFMLSPTWVFGVPGLVAVLGAAIILANSFAHASGLLAGEPFFGVSWAVIAAFSAVCGHFALLVAVATHFFGVRNGFRRLRSSLQKLEPVLTLETMLFSGLAMVAVAAGCLVFVGMQWTRGGFEALANPVPLIAASALGAIGFQTVLGGFLLAIIAGNDSRLTPRQH